MKIIPQSVLELFGLDGTTAVSPSPILTYSDIQTHLKLDGSADQADVSAMIAGATQRIEAYIDRKLVTQHWSIYYDCFPRDYKKDQWWDGARDGAVSELYSSDSPLELPFGPCQSIAFIHALDQTDGTTVIDSTTYSVDNIGPVGRIALKIGGLWPSITLRPVNGVRVRGVFGIGSASVIPMDIKQALKITVANFYEKRGDSLGDPQLPTGAQLLLEPYRRYKIK
jgi:hypothetical protein